MKKLTSVFVIILLTTIIQIGCDKTDNNLFKSTDMPSQTDSQLLTDIHSTNQNDQFIDSQLNLDVLSQSIEPEKIIEEPPVIEEKMLYELDELWSKLYGCWSTTDEKFAYFTYADGKPAFIGGIWENWIPYNWSAGIVTALTYDLNGRYIIELIYPLSSLHITDINDSDLKVFLSLDISEFDQNKKISLTFWDNTELSYIWSGISYNDAYDATHDIQFSSFQEMQEIWRQITGLWVNEEGNFIEFSLPDENTLLFNNSNSSRGFGYFEKLMSSVSEIPLTLIIYYPPLINNNNQKMTSLPEMLQTVYIDISALYSQNVLRIQIGEGEDFVTYMHSNRQ